MRGSAERCVSKTSKVMLECSLWNTTSAETKLRLSAMDLLRACKPTA